MCEIVSLIAIKSKIGAPDKCRLSRCEQLFVKKVSHGHEARRMIVRCVLPKRILKSVGEAHAWTTIRVAHVAFHVMSAWRDKPKFPLWGGGGVCPKALRVSKVSRKTPTGVLELAPTGLAFDSGWMRSIRLVATCCRAVPTSEWLGNTYRARGCWGCRVTRNKVT